MNIEQEIIDLINLKKEGSYWDFKQQWYDKAHLEDLLHDIICMANNLEDRNAYIIIGVNNNFETLGIKEDQNRKNTHNLTDFLRDKPFAGNIRPLVEVLPIQVDEKTLDVIVIKQSSNTPFYLINSIKGGNSLKPFHIYTRINDTNTPKDSSADLDKVEILWKKRFGLDKKTNNLFSFLVKQTEKWKESPFYPNQSEFYISTFYHEEFPSITIRLQEDKDADAQESYMNDFPDATPHWFDIFVYDGQVLIYKYRGVGLDGCRQYIVAPHRYPNSSTVFYFITNSTEMSLSKILNNNDEEGIRIISSIKSILYFDNQAQFNKFSKEMEQKKISNFDIEQIQKQLDNG